MLIKTEKEAPSVAPMSCTVFLSHILVCLEGKLGEETWPQIQGRIPSRFGRVDYWLNGDLPEQVKALPDPKERTLEKDIQACDLLILVGSPEDILRRQKLAEGSQVMTLLITVASRDAYIRFKKDWGLSRSVFLGLPPGKEATVAVGRILDSLVGLFNYYEYGLVRFNMYDLRHIWPDNVDLCVEYYRSEFNPGSEQDNMTVKEHYYPWNQVILDPVKAGEELNSLLVVARGLEVPRPERLEKVLSAAQAGRTGKEGVHWYALGDCPLAPDQVEAVVFMCRRTGSSTG